MDSTIAAGEPPAGIGSAWKGCYAEIAKGAIFDFRRNLDAGIATAILIDDVGGIVPRQTVAAPDRSIEPVVVQPRCEPLPGFRDCPVVRSGFADVHEARRTQIDQHGMWVLH